MARHKLALAMASLFRDRWYLASLVFAYITSVVLSHGSAFQKMNMPAVYYLSLSCLELSILELAVIVLRILIISLYNFQFVSW